MEYPLRISAGFQSENEPLLLTETGFVLLGVPNGEHQLTLQGIDGRFRTIEVSIEAGVPAVVDVLWDAPATATVELRVPYALPDDVDLRAFVTDHSGEREVLRDSDEWRGARHLCVELTGKPLVVRARTSDGLEGQVLVGGAKARLGTPFVLELL